MKVGTDAVLLGAWVEVPTDCKAILEIGAGCGVISLMLVQRTNAEIVGIDIDENSVKEAQKNAENSLWKERVQFLLENVQDFAQKTTQKFDVIVSNPPFFENSLKSPETSRNISRHNDTLTLQQILNSVNILLSEKGRFGVILPVDVAEKLENLAIKEDLYATKKMYIYPTPTKKINRMMLMFEREQKVCEEENLIIRGNSYTDEYKQFMKEYLLIERMKEEETPKVLNVNNPVQAVGVARGRKISHLLSELRRSSTNHVLNCYAVLRKAGSISNPELRLRLARGYSHVMPSACFRNTN
jgi:tRNA1Val (adenine37-N6)-methyltransferase